MMEIHQVHEGSTPLLISVPHDGKILPNFIAERMTPAGKDLPDTDWHVAELYDFAKDMGASLVVANYSRYVVDLNRPPDDTALYAGQVATGICPSQSFAGDDLYINGAGIDQEERQERVHTFWRPYHSYIRAKLDAIRTEYGYALLWDAHSIPSQVPRLFDGALPVLNIGTNGGASCAPEIAAAVSAVATSSACESVTNGRFKGGYITRYYGAPDEGVHAIQLEIAQRAYMDEASREFDDAKATGLRETLSTMLDAFLETGTKSRP